MTEITTDVNAAVFGVNDENLRMMEEAFEVTINARGGEVQVQGDPANAKTALKLISDMQALAQRGLAVRKTAIRTAIRVLQDDPSANLVEFFTGDTLGTTLRKVVKPRTLAQKTYLEKIENNDMTFAIGPAGTGKTYLAVAVAAAALNEKLMKRIVLCRPAVEAGEKLGFLPGDLAEKINPYLRPLYDSLYELLGFEKVEKLIEKNIIEVAPLAFMRGRTLSDAFIILDEAQNTTTEQMKMFLTRMGFGSKAVITGDITQVDLPTGKRSGLREARDTLQNIDGISFIEFTDRDVVRHPLVSRIVTAYAAREAALEQSSSQAEVRQTAPDAD